MDHKTFPANKAKLKSDTFFDYLLENSQVSAILVLDSKGFICASSQGVQKSYGYSTEDLIGKHFSLLFIEEDRLAKKPEIELSTVLSQGQANDFNYIIHKDGSYIWSSGESIFAKDSDGEIYIVKYVQDMNQEKMLKEFLTASESKNNLLAEIFNSEAHGLILFKTICNEENKIVDFEYVLINRTTEKLLGKSKDELLGKKWLEVYPHMKDLGTFDIQLKTMISGKTQTTDFYYGYQGYNKWYKNKYIKISSDKLLVTFDDITDQKLASLKLEKASEFLLDTQSIALIGSFDWDIVNDTITGTPELFRILNFTQPKPSFQDFLSKVHPEDVEYIKSTVQKAIDSRQPIDMEYRIVYSDGSFRHIWDRSKIIYNEEEKAIRILGTISDITKLKSIELQLKTVKSALEHSNIVLEEKVKKRTTEIEQVNRKLSTINQDLDKYAYVISHDLKAPLAAIEGLVPFLKEDYQNKPLDNEALEMLDMIRLKTQDMRNIIEEVLKSAKQLKKTKEETNIYEVTREIIKMLNPPEHFHFLLQHSLPTVTYNKIALMQIMQNLISNAIKYTDKAQPIIRVTSKLLSTHYLVCVEDNGPGIPEEKLPKIFTPFETFDQRKEIESHGLGLSIVKKLVEENGGKIWVDSELGIKTMFHFTIPKS